MTRNQPNYDVVFSPPPTSPPTSPRGGVRPLRLDGATPTTEPEPEDGNGPEPEPVGTDRTHTCALCILLPEPRATSYYCAFPLELTDGSSLPTAGARAGQPERGQRGAGVGPSDGRLLDTHRRDFFREADCFGCDGAPQGPAMRSCLTLCLHYTVPTLHCVAGSRAPVRCRKIRHEWAGCGLTPPHVAWAV